MVGVGGAPSAQAVSTYRAARHLRSGGLHRALKLGPDADFTDDHVEQGLASKNGHVQAMAGLVKRMRDSAKKPNKEVEGSEDGGLIT